MSSRIRNCVRDLEKGRNLEKQLPEYVEQFMQMNSSSAELRLMMEYYMFYETVSEGINPYIDSARETADALHKIIEVFYEGNPSEERIKELEGELLALRQGVVERMQVLTAYVDCFTVYEYILNRVQYRFEDREMLPEDSVFAQDLVSFIFSSHDNVTINENIRYALGQLPMRITRTRYFDLIRNTVSIYKGSDKSSLDDFLYRFRTNAMLYRNEQMNDYFTEFVPVLEELAALDYENIDRQTYRIYEEKLRINVSKLKDISDLYMQLGQLVNEMYILCASSAYSPEREEPDAAELVIRGINAIFMERESGIWKYSGETTVETEEEKLYWLGEQFVCVEGKQESLNEAMNIAGAVLEEVMESHQKLLMSMGLSENVQALKKMSFLSSGSIFAELEERETGEKVTEQMADAAAGDLIAECKAFFQGKSRMVRRAVMANTLENMPVFFTTAQEVADYVVNSFSQCSDEAEKYAAKLLLSEIMQ